MTKIICFAGRKGSGKNTLCNFLHGYQMKACEKIEDFDLTENGELIIKAKNEEDELVHAKIDTTRTDLEFSEWAAYNMWPFVKQYAFATPMKEMMIHLFNVPRNNVFGTEEEKSEKVDHLLWENMPGVLLKSDCGLMSAREFMQYFGTEIMRTIYPPIWTNYCLEQIKEQDSQLAIITDGRFDNEVEAVQQAGGKVIYLTRSIDNDNHASETGITPSKCDDILDNINKPLLETCKELLQILKNLGVSK